MSSRLHRIDIGNFKAFRGFSLNVEGRHLLVYGANGSGKSSLYWALYTFLQSARKSQESVAKYFDPNNTQNLLNIFEDAAKRPGEIALTLRETASKNDTTYHINLHDHGTHNQPAILKGDLASDFVTYRFFFGFSDFRNSERFDIWPLFENEILPFCVSTSGQIPLDCWNAIKSGDANPNRLQGRAGLHAHEKFEGDTNTFASILPGIVDSISVAAQEFYNRHFALDDPLPITLKLGVSVTPKYDRYSREFVRPMVEFGIQVGGTTVSRPHVFLNEAKLTQLALSVRFAASLVNLHESDFKLLVLDDLLVSLDMSNRMKVVEILLSETFAGYQKIILTHELGFFREFRRKIAANQAEWCLLRLQGASDGQINGVSEKTDLQLAEDYLRGYSLDEAALRLRKAAEDMGRRWREWLEKKELPPGQFLTLTENLRAARKHLFNELPIKIMEQIVEPVPAAVRGLLVAISRDDIDQIEGLDPATKGILTSKRGRLRQAVTTDHSERLRKIKLIDDILACTERVLNPSAHDAMQPLYEKEIQDALNLIKQLEIASAL
jgi:ABC-type Mn2+/Zn2+ transport system ATPase subunit